MKVVVRLSSLPRQPASATGSSTIARCLADIPTCSSSSPEVMRRGCSRPWLDERETALSSRPMSTEQAPARRHRGKDGGRTGPSARGRGGGDVERTAPTDPRQLRLVAGATCLIETFETLCVLSELMFLWER